MSLMKAYIENLDNQINVYSEEDLCEELTEELLILWGCFKVDITEEELAVLRKFREAESEYLKVFRKKYKEIK
jgi:hypothetical protein